MSIGPRAAPWLLVMLATAGCAGAARTGPTAVQRASMLVDRGQPDQAARLLRDHLREHPQAVPERRMLLRVLAVSGDLPGARRQAKRLRGLLGAGSPVPDVELGHAYELAHRYDEALEHYDRAARRAPADPAGPREGGLRAARWGEPELAEPRLELAVQRDPTDPEVWHALGLVRAKLGDLAGARKAYRAGLRADPDASENRLGLATLAVLEGDSEAALAEYEALLVKRPRFAAGHLGRSWALLRLGRLDEAEEAIDRGARLGAESGVVRRQRRLLRALRKRQQVKVNR